MRTSQIEFPLTISILVILLAVMLGWEALVGHYRSGFALKAQYIPFFTTVALVVAGIAAIALPGSPAAAWALTVTGWLAIAAGVIGAGYHHYYGIVEKPGAYRWWLHHLMYHAPALAPLGGAAVGGLAVLAGAHIRGVHTVWGVAPARGVLVVAAAALLGGVLQSGILHYRGAFNNPAMYLPFTAPLAAGLACMWLAIDPASGATPVAAILLWLTVLVGFVGLGMHLRGIDRQMGGLYITSQNLMQGPPLWAPVTLSGFAGAALAALYQLP